MAQQAITAKGSHSPPSAWSCTPNQGPAEKPAPMQHIRNGSKRENMRRGTRSMIATLSETSRQK
jgi:hypothetical protein